METGSQPASPRTPSLAPEPLDPEHKLDPPPLESEMFQDLRVVLKALGRPKTFIGEALPEAIKECKRLGGSSTGSRP